MKKLTDYLDVGTLQRVQDEFSAVAGRPIRICAIDGQPLVRCTAVTGGELVTANEGILASLKRRKPASRGAMMGGVSEVPVVLDDEVAGRIQLSREGIDDACCTEALAPLLNNILPLMSNVLVQLCESAMQLRQRIEQLLALHRVTAEITGGHELQEILDTVTATVVETIPAKASIIRLLADNGQDLRIQSGCNVSKEYLAKGPVRVDQSQIDQEVVHTGLPVYVADMASDPRVTFSEAAQKEGFVSNLCVPMVYQQHCEGVIRVYTGQWHEFDWFETELVKTIANAAAAAISHTRLDKEAAHSWEIKRQVSMAGEVQRRMIPSSSPQMTGFDIYGRYVPSQDLAGDFFDYIPLPPDNLGVAICDVVGKGVRASLLMASVRASLRAHAMNVYDMEQVLERVNSDMCSDTLISDFATMFYGVFNQKTLRMTYSCAGHLPPMLVRDGEVQYLRADGGVIGMLPEMSYPTSILDLQPGDVLLAFTDGITEAINFADEQYGKQRLEKALLFAVGQGYSAEAITKYCLWDMRRFAGLQHRMDDTTVIAIRVLDTAGQIGDEEFPEIVRGTAGGEVTE